MSRPSLSRSLRPAPGSPWGSTGVVFLGNMVARGLGFLFPVILARVLARDEFGLVYFFINTGFFVGELVLTGLPTAMTRAIAAAPDGTRGPWVASAIVAGVPILGVSIMAGSLLAVLGEASPLLVALVVVGLSVDAYYFAVLRGLGRFGILMLYRIGANFVQILLVLLLVLLDLATVTTVVLVYAFVYLVPIALIEASRHPVAGLLSGSLSPAVDRIRALVRFAIPAMISGVAYGALMGLDVTFVRLLAPEALADYGAARALAMVMSLVPYAIAIVLLPRVAAADETRRWSLLQRALAVTSATSLAAVVGFWIAAPWLVELIYPSGFEAAAAILPMLALALAVLGLYSVLSQWWLGIDRPGAAAVCLVIGALSGAALQLLLTPELGGEGAAIALAGGSTIALASLGALTVRRWAGGLVA